MNPADLSHFLTHHVVRDTSCVVPVILPKENFFRGRLGQAMEFVSSPWSWCELFWDRGLGSAHST